MNSVMSVKCEQPLDELTIQVWLQYDHPNLNGTELQTDKWTDGRMVQILDALSGRGHKNYNIQECSMDAKSIAFESFFFFCLIASVTTTYM